MSKIIHLLNAHFNVIYPRYQGLPPDKEAFERHIADLTVKLEVYDKILSKQKYLVGDVSSSG